MVNYDVLVVGAGPSGLTGAIACAENGLRVLIVDEGIQAGGQLPKQTHKFFGHEGFFASVRGFQIGKILVNKAKELCVEFKLQSTVTGVYEDSVVVYDRVLNKTEEYKPKYILFATGASERFLAFKNNTLPGIYGAGAVQTLMNQYGVLPGKEFLIVGAGNIGLIVAYQLVQAGAKVKAILEAANKVGGYAVHSNKVKRMGIPILLNHTIVEALGEERVKGVVVCQIDENFNKIEGTEKEFSVDTICLAVGLLPTVELVAQTGAKIEYVPELGGYVPYRDKDMRTSVPNVFIAGDLSGIEEASTAMLEGYIAGYNIVQDLTGKEQSEKLSKYKKELEEFRKGPFSKKVREGLKKFGIEFPEGGYRTEVQTEKPKFNKFKAFIECPQNIPCNPCETSCPTGAISVGGNINGIPWIDYEKCVGCGICVTKCPGLAIFMYKKDEDGYSVIGIPYEESYIPKKGEKVIGLNKEGKQLCECTVENITINNKEKTHIVYLKVEDKYVDEVRYFKTLEEDKEYICRCEEITRKDVEDLIDSGITDYEEIRRVLRIGMGPCGGKTCRAVVLNIIANKTGKSIADIELGFYRPPVIPLPFEAITNQLKEENKDGE